MKPPLNLNSSRASLKNRYHELRSAPGTTMRRTQDKGVYEKYYYTGRDSNADTSRPGS